MGAWSAPIAFSSWWLFYGLTDNVGWFNKWLILNQVRYTPGIIVLLVVEAIIFAFGLVIFLWGVIQIATVKLKKEGLVTRGLYKYIRHPQLLGLIIIGFSLTLYMPETEDQGVKIGEIISWSFFSLILFLWSDFEEKQLAKKFGEEFIQYRSRTGSFLPRIFNKTKERKNFYEIKYCKRYLFTFLGYSGFYLIMYLLTYILSLPGIEILRNY
ncbi:MAG: methyltransferase family protein [Candidatus Heimdallarchaeaceae archaeon]